MFGDRIVQQIHFIKTIRFEIGVVQYIFEGMMNFKHVDVDVQGTCKMLSFNFPARSIPSNPCKIRNSSSFNLLSPSDSIRLPNILTFIMIFPMNSVTISHSNSPSHTGMILVLNTHNPITTSDKLVQSITMSIG